MPIVDIRPTEAFQLLKDHHSDIMILDIRTPMEFQSEKIDKALNLNYYDSDFRDKIDKLERSQNYFLYCRTGSRSSDAKRMMEEMGFVNVYHLVGGILAWMRDGLPVD